MIDLVLGVKTSTWRIHDTQAQDADAAFCAIRDKVLQRDRMTCQGCGAMTTVISGSDVKRGTWRGSGYFEVHHIDDDHTNNALSNLVLLCPYCHNVFHCGNAGHRGAGILIDAPWISQSELNALTHALFAVISRGEDRVYTGQESTTDPKSAVLSQQEAQIVIEAAEEARRAYASLRNLSFGIEQRFGQGMSQPAQFGRFLMELHRRSAQHYENRQSFLAGVRLLADYDVYNTPINDRLISPIEFWSTRRVNAGYSALEMPDRLADWTRRIKHVFSLAASS